MADTPKPYTRIVYELSRRLPPACRQAWRKGRIRFCLAIILAVAGFTITTALLASSGGSPAAQHTGASPDFTTAAGLFTQCRPRLTCAVDTLQTGSDSIIAWFSLDTALQNFIRRIMKQYRPRYGAAVVMDPESGRVLALVSYRHDSMPDIGSDLFLRSIFPAASIYKTVTAAAAVENAHYTAQTMVPVTGRNHTLYRFQLKREISPWNKLRVEDAFAFSINPAFARIGMYDVGKKVFEAYSRGFGFNARIPFELACDPSQVCIPDDTSYAMAEFASGFNNRTTLSPLHGALIASAVAENGAMPCPRLIDSICRTDGQCLFRSHPSVWKKPIQSSTARELRVMMKRAVEAGTCRKAFKVLRRCAWSESIECGGKTGSIDVDSLGKVDWFIGFAADRNAPGRSLATAVVTVHGRQWTVHSSYIGAEIFRRNLRPAPQKQIAKKKAPSVNISKG